MSKESAPSGGDPLEIVPDLTEGDDAAPGDRPLSPTRPSRALAGTRPMRSRTSTPTVPRTSRIPVTSYLGNWPGVRLRQRIGPDAGLRRHQRLRPQS